MRIAKIFQPDHERHEGVRPINVYLLRFFFLLMFLFVGYDSWSLILGHQGPWDPVRAVAWSMFAAYSALSILGVLHPLRMLPVFVFMIFYKTIWLLAVAYPLWASNQLAGSPAEGMARVFIWVPLTVVITPWRYVFETYVLNRKGRLSRERAAQTRIASAAVS